MDPQSSPVWGEFQNALWASSAFWVSCGLLLSSPQGSPDRKGIFSLTRLPALHSQGGSRVKLDTLGKGGLATGSAGIAGDVS